MHVEGALLLVANIILIPQGKGRGELAGFLPGDHAA
jgi:hypothetical protein